MMKIVIFLMLLTQFPQRNNTSGVCPPNTQMIIGDKVCTCNSNGEFDEANCHSVDRRHSCRPDQIVFQGCNRCVCQENGQLSCSEDSCANQQIQNIHESFNAILPWCKPFKTYYFSCHICVCPASGKSAESKCVIDVSCTLFKEPTAAELSSKLNTCIAQVMYLFPCMECHCSDEGLLTTDKCVETCKKQKVDLTKKCIPNTLYRRSCNVCFCPEHGLPDDKLCTQANCTESLNSTELTSLRNKSFNCTVDHFTQPRCIYCNCTDGRIDNKNCFETECLKMKELKYNELKESCSPGEIVPFCIECFCPPSGRTSDDFCTETCSNQSKVKVLEKVVQADLHNMRNKSVQRTHIEDEKCEPNSIYYDNYNGKYCICPDTGVTNFNLCKDAKDPLYDDDKTGYQKFTINFSEPCEPNTLVDFDCNTCFCSKKGKIDPKWCTYDDCNIIKAIRELYAERPGILSTVNTTCTPGSIFKNDCNFCICRDNGLVDKSTCTLSDCSALKGKVSIATEKLTCVPNTYYQVDCNVCFCPRDGLKNIAKCTKNQCDGGFLRSEDCTPGQLFSQDCNICICPPDGNKADKACTKSQCSEATPWKKIFQLSESLMENHVVEDATRNLDLCFPGEEYVSGCKLCMCPDMGLRYFSVCTPSFCEEDRPIYINNATGDNRKLVLKRRSNDDEECIVYNATTSTRQTNSKCSPGSMYIIKCQQCICPYMGDINSFCRKLPVEFHCEKAFPGINYIPMARRHFNGTMSHTHSHYECAGDGKYKDDCFVCECLKGSVISEHCFRSDAKQCVNATPSFLAE